MSYGLNAFACFIFWQRQARSRLRRETCEWMSLAEAGLGKFKAHLNCELSEAATHVGVVWREDHRCVVTAVIGEFAVTKSRFRRLSTSDKAWSSRFLRLVPLAACCR